LLNIQPFRQYFLPLHTIIYEQMQKWLRKRARLSKYGMYGQTTATTKTTHAAVQKGLCGVFLLP
jgi:hypothetical protein